ncbi:MAG TPA: SPFH domain-containing protein [Pseudobacteroides sp.]|uniref:SPFH domain-containing protein n=1 Tax=Pseudobacteroides sp. TaxID=1968840 RepID=UPI002F9599DC
MKELNKEVSSGLLMFFVDILMLLASIGGVVLGIIKTNTDPSPLSVGSIIGGAVLFVVWCIFTGGFFTLQPNEAAVLILFGEYRGTVKKPGWHFANPFFTKKKISLRSRNLNGDKLKVNDEAGNPIEIAAVIVWRVENTFQAVFDVENYVDYVKVQSESAIRHIAGMYPYDITDQTHNISLRGSADEVSESLKNELQERLGKAGVIVEEARLSHLAYSPEIAAAMLQRQQASAIIAARQKIVEGAVGMVRMALDKLNEDGIVELDEERKAAMVSNLLVVLCGERSTQPVINTGTLHN